MKQTDKTKQSANERKSNLVRFYSDRALERREREGSRKEIQDFTSDIQTAEVEQEQQPKTHKNAWTQEEDTKLLELVKKYPARGRWAKIAEEMGKKYHQVFTRYKYLSKPKKSKKKPLFKRNGALDEKQRG